MATKKEPPKRLHDVRVEVTKGLFMELNHFWNGPKKGVVLDGRIDKKGNFVTRWTHPISGKRSTLTIYPTHFRILGRFYFRKAA